MALPAPKSSVTVENVSIVAPGGQRPLVLITGHRRENFGSGFEAICRAIAGTHHGSLHVADSPHGARFVLRLPLRKIEPSPAQRITLDDRPLSGR